MDNKYLLKRGVSEQEVHNGQSGINLSMVNNSLKENHFINS